MAKSRQIIKKAVKQVLPSTPTPEYMPSTGFMYSKVNRPSRKAHFVKVASEIELFKDIYGETELKRMKFDDSTWTILMEMDWNERFNYLMGFRKEPRETEQLEAVSGSLISAQNQLRLEAGEMVYARNFHSLVDIYGEDFRRKIDRNYGRNLMKQEKTPKFIVDCRFLRDFSVISQRKFTSQMQALHEDNWTSSRPFSIHFANYQADTQLQDVAKRNLLFQYGPPGKSENFQRHPFAPTITSRRIDSVEKKENLIYISPRATRFVPDVLPSNINGVVICLSNDASPATSSASACIADKVVPYTIPFRRFISSESFRPNFVQLWQLGRIFREYFNGASIGEGILSNIDNLIHKPKKARREVDERDEEFRLAMLQINNERNR